MIQEDNNTMILRYYDTIWLQAATQAAAGLHYLRRGPSNNPV